MTATHRINESFMQDLQNGMLNPLLNAVREDDTLMLGLRGSYITVYYRGCQLLKLEQKAECRYSALFDKKYDKQGTLSGDFFKRDLPTPQSASEYVSSIGQRKQLIDHFLGTSRKHEREFQQVAVWENNRSALANETEYFITDIEHKHEDARFDMLGIRWLAEDKKRHKLDLAPVIVEMKFGNNALKDDAGLVDHLEAYTKRLTGKNADEFRRGLFRNIESQFEQLAQLGLLSFNRPKNIEKFEIPEDAKPIVVFVLAGYNPRSDHLWKMLNELKAYATPLDVGFHLRFFVSTFAGYAMHEVCMLNFEEFSALLQRLRTVTSLNRSI